MPENPLEPNEIAKCASFTNRRATTLGNSGLGTIPPTEPILNVLFGSAADTSWLLYEPIISVSQVKARNDDIFMFADVFTSAFDCITVRTTTQLSKRSGSQNAVRVDFDYHGVPYFAIAFGNLPKLCGAQSAALIIPGSGANQASSIITNQASNYHFGVMNALAEANSVFTLIKPNEDILAWHNGAGSKVRDEALFNYQINRGGSYSVSYLVQSIAVVKWMKSCYAKTIVAGLSQGGAAAMLNALQSRPTAVVVSSGHSLLFDAVEFSGHNQLLNVPGYSSLFKPATFRSEIARSPSRWLFSWGRAETDYYLIEATTRYTASFIQDLPNVEIAVHDAGHVFPVPEVQRFVANVLR